MLPRARSVIYQAYESNTLEVTLCSVLLQDTGIDCQWLSVKVSPVTTLLKIL